MFMTYVNITLLVLQNPRIVTQINFYLLYMEIAVTYLFNLSALLL